MYYIGIDLGTSSLKLLLCDEAGVIHNSVSEEYPLSFPQPGWSEQNPQDWWEALEKALPKLIRDIDRTKIRGIGCGGQMHGLVALDENDCVIRPCILWNDGRTEEEVTYLNETIGKKKLSACTANIAFAGFTAPKILWMKKNEPENFHRISKIMLPKDYLNYRLTSVFSTDYSDASGMLLMDVKNKCWSKEMLKICGITEDMLPKLHESYDVIGTITPEIAEEFDLPKDVIVVAGAGDNAAAAVGTATVSDGDCNISLGTSGTVFISSDSFRVDDYNALHSFAHAGGNYHLMGCMLSAASCNKWFAKEVLMRSDYDAMQSEITEDMLGNNSIYFLPYLMGERSPINDTNARACFIGMDMHHTQTDLYQAVLDGVAFAIRDSVEVAKQLGIRITESNLCGGGSKSSLWRKIMANVLGIRLAIPVSEEGPGYGGAMLAMVGDRKYPDVTACAKALVKIKGYEEVNPAIAARYEEKYRKYRLIYPALKDVFEKIR